MPVIPIGPREIEAKVALKTVCVHEQLADAPNSLAAAFYSHLIVRQCLFRWRHCWEPSPLMPLHIGFAAEPLRALLALVLRLRMSAVTLVGGLDVASIAE